MKGPKKKPPALARVTPGAKFDIGPFNITVVGRFNRHIVEPQWAVSQGIIPEGDVEVMMPIGEQRPIFRLPSGLGWTVQQDRLIVFGNKAEAPKFVSDLLESLPHTPLTAAGVNFRSVAKNKYRPADHAVSLQHLLEKESIDSSESRSWLLPGAVKLTVKVTWSKAARVLDINFHTQATDPRVVSQHASRVSEFESMVSNLEAAV